MTAYNEERIGELLGLLKPAPAGWVKAAQELPFSRLDEIVARAEADEVFRQALVADLESALEAEGYERDPLLLEALRDRLEEA
jgi:hypothetical protein